MKLQHTFKWAILLHLDGWKIPPTYRHIHKNRVVQAHYLKFRKTASENVGKDELCDTSSYLRVDKFFHHIHLNNWIILVKFTSWNRNVLHNSTQKR